ncbi:MAG: tRNA lysidine(34) synthetase TilS [Desulfarculaceae bacterium]|nr:tRNA lysidine(34) synthetase TilS [Desulfarculaceae bacterium]MCF8070990.1 tRNA lysidine(34) synthetase TilS [Desulfarculaceae bacterium]MCF8100578.1 tRNA lysidine(34) synthetase TilS [Desulfarculaceae bacterium]MCF8117710.1 tRNA lysidine(34) synthetase TilS [Desulfarculaceae bacterium]
MSLSPPPERVKLAELALGGPLPGPGPMLAAVSGGADSVALARLLALAAPEHGWRLVLAHVDHGLRPTSGDDASFVAALAGELEAKCLLRRVAVERAGRSLEEAAREARREALLAMADEAGAGAIALGHTLEDQAETVLMRLLTGSGPAGLAAMRPWSPPWWRPLLGLRREALRAWLGQEDHPWREDPSNQDLSILRNRVRHRLMPLAQELVNPRAPQALARLARVAGAEEELWEAWCTQAARRIMRRQGTSLLLEAEPLAEMPLARQGRLLRHAVRELTGSSQGLLALHVEQLLELLAGEAGRKLTLPSGFMAWREPEGLRLDRAAPPPGGAITLHGPATVGLPHLGARLRLELVGEKPGLSGRGPTACLPAGAVRWPLELRPPLPGERFHPLGAPGSKRLSRILIDYKVPAWWRARTLVLADADGPWWAAPWTVAERARLKGTESAYLRLSFVDTPQGWPYTMIFNG